MPGAARPREREDCSQSVGKPLPSDQFPPHHGRHVQFAGLPASGGGKPALSPEGFDSRAEAFPSGPLSSPATQDSESDPFNPSWGSGKSQGNNSPDGSHTPTTPLNQYVMPSGGGVTSILPGGENAYSISILQSAARLLGSDFFHQAMMNQQRYQLLGKHSYSKSSRMPLQAYARPADAHGPLLRKPRPSLVVSDLYAQPPMTSRVLASDPYGTKHQMDLQLPSSRHCGQSSMTPQTSPTDPYSRAPVTPKLSASVTYGQLQRTTSDPYDQELMSSRSPPSDPYGQPPMTPRPPTAESYSQPQMTPTRLAASDLYGQPPMMPRTSAADPYEPPPMTPRPTSLDQYSQPPMIMVSHHI